MKTTARFAPGATLRSTLFVALAALHSFGGVAYGQDKRQLLAALHQPAPAPEKPLFRAAVFPSVKPLRLVVLVENPAREQLTFTLKDGKGEPVFRKTFGRVAKYNGRLDVSALADGAYTFQISGKSSRYTRHMLLRTAATREAKMQ